MEKKRFILFIGIILFFIVLSSSAFILAQEPPSPETKARYKKGLEYAAGGKFKEAGEQFKENLRMDKSDTTSSSSLGALRDFHAGKINEGYTLSLFKGLNYAYDGKSEQAIKELQKAIEISPDYPKAYNILGIVYAALGNSEQAIAYFQKAIEISPKYAEACYNLAAVYHALGQYPEAITHYQKVIQGDPNSLEARINIGAAYVSLGQYSQAITHLQKATEIDDKCAGAYYSLGLVYLMSDQYAKSQENLQKAKELYQQKKDSKGVQTAEKYLEKLRLISNSVKTSH